MEREFGKYFQILRFYQTIAPKIVMVGSDQIIRTQIQKDAMNDSRTVSLDDNCLKIRIKK